MKSKPPKTSVLFLGLKTANLESGKAKIQHASDFHRSYQRNSWYLFYPNLLYFGSDSSCAFTGVHREDLF